MLKKRTWGTEHTGILGGKVFGSKTWSEGYFVVFASSAVRNDFAKLSSLMSAAFNWSRRRLASVPMPAR